MHDHAKLASINKTKFELEYEFKEYDGGKNSLDFSISVVCLACSNTHSNHFRLLVFIICSFVIIKANSRGEL